MTGSKERKRQKKLERSRKKRQVAQERARSRSASLVPRGAEIAGLARSGSFGPAWIGEGYDEIEGPPSLVTIVITRRARGLLLAEVALVDRTCLGVKNAHVLPPMSDVEIDDGLHSLGLDLVPCEPLLAQSVVFRALDYARSLGFEPHADFVGAFFEPRPEQLLDTPWARPDRPVYISGPSDDAPRIIAKLSAKVGPDGFEFVSPLDAELDDWDEEDDDGWDEDEGESSVVP